MVTKLIAMASTGAKIFNNFTNLFSKDKLVEIMTYIYVNVK